MEENGGKEHLQGISCLHLASFLKTYIPLLIILQQPQSKTGFLEGIKLGAIDCMQMSKGGGTNDNSEEKSEIEAFS